MFHSFRDGNLDDPGLRARLWRFHDRHPLPGAAHRLARSILFRLGSRRRESASLARE